MYDLVKTFRGKSKVVMTDTLSKVRAQMKKLRDAQRGQKVAYSIQSSSESVKFKQKPAYHGSR